MYDKLLNDVKEFIQSLDYYTDVEYNDSYWIAKRLIDQIANDNLKCCGNCSKWGYVCSSRDYHPQRVCYKWEYDGLTREEREV